MSSRTLSVGLDRPNYHAVILNGPKKVLGTLICLYLSNKCHPRVQLVSKTYKRSYVHMQITMKLLEH